MGTINDVLSLADRRPHDGDIVDYLGSTMAEASTGLKARPDDDEDAIIPEIEVSRFRKYSNPDRRETEDWAGLLFKDHSGSLVEPMASIWLRPANARALAALLLLAADEAEKSQA